jgi:hypothetical protein
MYFEKKYLHRNLQPIDKEFSIPNLKAHQTLILYNAAFHRSQITKELVEATKCEISPAIN